MLIDSENIIRTKEYLDVMQAFTDGKEIEFKKRFQNDHYRTANTPDWDFVNYAYRIKHSEPEFMYPIYKRLKHAPETVVEFHSINSGIYISTFKDSNYKPGDVANNMAPHTDSAWEDYTVSIDAEKILLSSDTIELFEVMVYGDIMKEFMIRQVLYSDEALENYRNSIKTGRSFIINKSTKQLVKVNNN